MKHIIKKTLVFLTALIAVLALTGCGSKNTIDLTQYVQVNVSGADGYGCASADADDIGLEALLLSDDESDADSLVKLDMLMRIRYEIDKKDHLSNGDKVSVTVTYPDGLAEALDADITPKSGDSWTVEIGGLGEPERIDVFEGMTIEYGNGNTLCADGLYTALKYTLSQTQGLSNGDTVTITVSAPDGNTDLESHCMETYGWMPLSESCEYTITGIDEYPIRLEDIPEELFEELRMIAQMQLEAMAEQMHSSFGDQGYRMNHYALDKVYVASPGENIDDDNKNEVYLVYRINADNPDGTRDYFYSAKFSNVSTKAEGEYGYDTHVVYPDGDYGFFFNGENYFCTGTEGEGFIGFESEQAFYNWYLADWEENWLINIYDIEE
jgi:hypothetical protein